MYTKLRQRFNINTRFAIGERVKGYVDRRKSKMDEIEELKIKHGINHLLRFDLGENSDGFSQKVKNYLNNRGTPDKYYHQISEYPETSHLNLCKEIGSQFGLTSDSVVLGTGSEYFIDVISRIVIEEGDYFITPSPSFYLFEDYSARCGGKQCSLPLDEYDNFAWTETITKNLFDDIKHLTPKLKIIWIANPNNPSGQIMDIKTVEIVVDFANKYNVFVVVDEAYGEFMDTKKTINSAASLLSKYENLIVIRTFSKVYGLAGARLGYMLSCSQDIIDAVMAHRNVFPITQDSLLMAYAALGDNDFLERTREVSKRRIEKIRREINRLTTFLLFPSSTNVFMIRSKKINASELNEQFLSKGIITSPVHINGQMLYLRITVRSFEDNEYFCSVCKEIDLKYNKTINI